MPLASNPVEVGGRNRVWRKLLLDAITTDPTWKNGDYTEQPRGLSSAIGFLLMATSVPLQWQKQFPTQAAADAWLADQLATRTRNTDANDMIYYYRAIEDYDPSPYLAEITAPLLAINSADDFVNPPELPMMEALIKQVPKGRYRPAAHHRRDARARHAFLARHLGPGTGKISLGDSIALLLTAPSSHITPCAPKLTGAARSPSFPIPTRARPPSPRNSCCTRAPSSWRAPSAAARPSGTSCPTGWTSSGNAASR